MTRPDYTMRAGSRRVAASAALAAFLSISAVMVAAPFATAAPTPTTTEDVRGSDATRTREERPSTLNPVLQIPVPTIGFSNIVVETEGNIRTIDVPWLANYLSGAYRYAVGAAAVIAATLMMIGGFQYMTAGGDASRVAAGKEKISNALIGLFLTVGAYVILYTVNPDILNLDTLKIRTIKRQDYVIEESFADVDPTARTVCNTVETCTTFCATCPTGTEPGCPQATQGMMNPDEAQTVPTMDGLRGNNIQAAPGVISGLQRAASIASSQGCTIIVRDGYRPLARQIRYVCDRIRSGNTSSIGSAVAWPGGSNHGRGTAVDLSISCGGQTLTIGCSAQASGTSSVDLSRTLETIMSAAGARRYNNEIWHWEFGSTSGCRCTAPSCPDPPMPCSGNC